MPKPITSGGDVTSAFLNDLVGVYDRSTAAVDVVNTTTTTAIYSKSIGANHLSTDRMLRLTILGDYLNNTGVSRFFSLAVLFGGAVVFDDSSPDVDTSGNRRPLRICIEMGALGATNAQYLNGTLAIGAADAPSTGTGRLDAGMTSDATLTVGENYMGTIAGSGTIDTTAAQTLEVRVSQSAASASLSFRKRYANLELL